MKTRHTNIPAAYLILFQNNKTLLLKRSNTGFADGFYSLVAGHVELNESFSQCIIREAQEEAGIVIKAEDLKAVHLMHRKSTDSERVDLFFLADKWEGNIENLEPHKCSEIRWFDLDNLPDNTVPYVKVALLMVQKKVFYSEDGFCP